MPKREASKNHERFNDDQLGQIRSVVAEGLDQIVLPRLDRLDEGQSRLDGRVASLQQGQARLEKGHTALFAQVQRMDDKLAELIVEVKAIKKQLTRFITREEYEELKTRVVNIEQQLKAG